jgi:hypothetical protein
MNVLANPPTSVGNLAINTVDEFARYEMLVCAVRTGVVSRVPRVGTVVEVAESK